MLRGEVWWVSFSSTVGGEVQKTRPAVIVSNDSANRHSNRVQVVPLTSNITKFYPCDSHVSIEGKACRAMTDQLMTVSKHRLESKICKLNEVEVSDLELAMRVQLALTW